MLRFDILQPYSLYFTAGMQVVNLLPPWKHMLPSNGCLASALGSPKESLKHTNSSLPPRNLKNHYKCLQETPLQLITLLIVRLKTMCVKGNLTSEVPIPETVWLNNHTLMKETFTKLGIGTSVIK